LILFIQHTSLANGERVVVVNPGSVEIYDREGE